MVKGKHPHYVVDGSTIKRLKKHCPKCGPGYIMAAHKDRLTCGKCLYSEFVSKKT